MAIIHHKGTNSPSQQQKKKTSLSSWLLPPPSLMSQQQQQQTDASSQPKQVSLCIMEPPILIVDLNHQTENAEVWRHLARQQTNVIMILEDFILRGNLHHVDHNNNDDLQKQLDKLLSIGLPESKKLALQLTTTINAANCSGGRVLEGILARSGGDLESIRRRETTFRCFVVKLLERQQYMYLQELVLQMPTIYKDAMSAFSRALAEFIIMNNNNLQKLTLGVALNPSGAQRLAESLLSCRHLRELRLDACDLGNDGVQSLAIHYLSKSNNNLQLLSLRQNELEDDGIAALVKHLNNISSLKTLDLSLNQIRSPGMANLARYLKHKRTNLQCLVLNHNFLGTAGIQTLARQGLSSLKELHLHDINCETPGLSALCNAKNSSLIHVDWFVRMPQAKSGIWKQRREESQALQMVLKQKLRLNRVYTMLKHYPKITIWSNLPSCYSRDESCVFVFLKHRPQVCMRREEQVFENDEHSVIEQEDSQEEDVVSNDQHDNTKGNRVKQKETQHFVPCTLETEWNNNLHVDDIDEEEEKHNGLYRKVNCCDTAATTRTTHNIPVPQNTPSCRNIMGHFFAELGIQTIVLGAMWCLFHKNT